MQLVKLLLAESHTVRSAFNMGGCDTWEISLESRPLRRHDCSLVESRVFAFTLEI